MKAEEYGSVLSKRVASVLARTRPGSTVEPLRVLPGGHSGLTYRAETSDGAVVVKAVPPGRRPIGRHDTADQIIAEPALDRGADGLIDQIGPDLLVDLFAQR